MSAIPTRAHYDVVVVGSGSAGGSAAARLSDDPSRSVLLLEAGTAYRSAAEFPERYRDPRQSAIVPGAPGHWPREVGLCPGTRIPSATGKVLGGSSSVNGTYFIRGRSSDFDAWARAGCTEWSFEKVLAYYRMSETDADFAGELHGTEGPIPVSRESRDRAPEFTVAFEAACASLGFASEPDKNGEQAPGFGPVPLNIADGDRVGTARGYILPRLDRPNFEVLGDAHVTRVRFAGRRAVGIEVELLGTRMNVDADRVIVATGAIRSPQLLMLSGIGPAEQLAAHGIGVVVDLPGVGRNLRGHPGLVAHFGLRTPIETPSGRGAMTSALHWSAVSVAEPNDLEILPFMRSVVQHRGDGAQERLSSVLLTVMQGDSSGAVTLASSDPFAEPNVDFDFMQTDADRTAARELVRTYYEIFTAEAMRDIGAQTIGLGREDVADDRDLDRWVRAHLLHGAHESSTCRMGPPTDPMAVVDQFGSVHGVDGLTVCDTSIWPTCTSRGPSATAVMTGERVAAFIGTGA